MKPALSAIALALLCLSTQAGAQSLVDAARTAARADRNAESARLFAQAIAETPARRREWLVEYADQLTYSQRAGEAVTLYQEALQAPVSADERLRALQGLGLALLWSDQPTPAQAVYRELLQARPGDADASRNLGRALSWGGRQREAIAHLQGHLAAHPGDSEARVLMAQAQAWMGRPDVAAATAAAVQRDDAQKLRLQLARDTAPRTELEGRRSTQSDDLGIQSWRIGHAIGLAGGRGTLGLRLDRVDYDRGDGSDSAQVTRPMVFGRWRFNDAFEWNAEAGRERIAPRATAATSFDAYSTWLTWWPHDTLRFDLSSARGDFDNLRSLRLGLTHRDEGLSVDYTPTERLRLTARWQHGDYSDGNARRWGEVEGEYRFRTHPDAWIGLKHTRFGFDRLLNNGYFNPLHFESTQLQLRTRWRPLGDEGDWEIEARGAFGREHAVPDGGKNAYDIELKSRWRIDRQTRLVATAQRFSSRTASSAGFARTAFGLGLERSW